MPSAPATTTARTPGQPPLIDTRRAKWIVAGLVVVVVGVVAWLFAREAGEAASAERWDVLAALRDQYEPREDPFVADASGVVRQQREAYLRRLQAFLESHAKGSGDLLEPHVRFLIAKAAKDILVAMSGVTDFEQRKPFHDEAIQQLTILSERFPDFPANWNYLAPTSKDRSTVSMLLRVSQEMRDYEEKTLPRDRMPKDDVVVLMRTTRGDIRLGVYAEDAPETVAAFLQKAREGRFDGTAFYEKKNVGGDDGGQKTLRGGDPATRDAKPYDRAQPLRFGKLEPSEQRLPSDSRHRIPHVPGVLSAWHGTSSEYDETGEFLLVAKASPDLDYNFTPIARALDDASLATVDRIWASPAWGEESATGERADGANAIEDFLQVPVRIVKVLVYEKGALSAGDVTPSPTRAEVEESEKSLSTVKADQFREEPPTKPAPPKPPEKPADDKPADEPKPADEKPAGETAPGGGN
jgi:cyclophilin family peptidyl-prolyl cis-trans isomerase